MKTDEALTCLWSVVDGYGEPAREAMHVVVTALTNKCPAQLDPSDSSCPYAGGACPVHKEALTTLEDEDEEAPKKPKVDPSTCPHANTTTDRGSPERFYPRRGCLDCDTWLDPVRVKARRGE